MCAGRDFTKSLATDSFHRRSKGMSFGRQKNLVRRAVRPDGRSLRDVRRRGQGRASLLDAIHGGPRPPSLAARVAAAIARLLGRR
jgi:hypothetical protein